MSKPAVHAWLNRLERLGRSLETWTIVLLLAGLIILTSSQIVLRNLFSIGVTWADGLTRLMVLWLALMGALAASREGRHITMNAVTRWLRPGLALAAALCADFVAAAFSGAMSWYSLAFVMDAREYGDTLLGDVPAWWLQLPMPLVFAAISWQFALDALERVREQFAGGRER